jgi:hypothetical protein
MTFFQAGKERISNNILDNFGHNKISSVIPFGDFWFIAKIPNLFIHIIYIPGQVSYKT